jgi:hypothetical protein
MLSKLMGRLGRFKTGRGLEKKLMSAVLMDALGLSKAGGHQTGEPRLLARECWGL